MSIILSHLVDDRLERADAALIAPTAQALRIWRRLHLELGEAAIHTDGGNLAAFVGLIATWYGAAPVVRVTTDADDGTVDVVSVANPAAAVERLKARCSAAPGLAAVDLSGRGQVIDVLLEALPRWGRLMLAAPNPEPFTTAFYTDIHRKGAQICSAELESIFDSPSSWELEISRARRLLADPKRAAQLRACAPAGASHPQSSAAGV